MTEPKTLIQSHPQPRFAKEPRNELQFSEIKKLFVEYNQRDAAPQVGQLGGSSLVPVEDSFDPDKRTLRSHVSTVRQARDGMVVVASAWERWMDIYRLNPVMTAGHKHLGQSGEPTVIGHLRDIEIKDNGDVNTDGFHATNFFSTTPLAEQYRTLYFDRSMRMFSVQWVIHKQAMRRYQGRMVPHVLEAETWAVGAVAVGSDRGALVKAIDAYEGLSGRSGGSELASRTCNRIEELLGPTIAQAYSRLGDIESVARDIPATLEVLECDTEAHIRSVIQDEIQRHLSPDGNGMLSDLIEQVVEVAMRHARPGTGDYFDDNPNPGTNPGTNPDPGTNSEAADRVDHQRDALHANLVDGLKQIAGAMSCPGT